MVLVCHENLLLTQPQVARTATRICIAKFPFWYYNEYVSKQYILVVSIEFDPSICSHSSLLVVDWMCTSNSSKYTLNIQDFDSSVHSVGCHMDIDTHRIQNCSNNGVYHLSVSSSGHFGLLGINSSLSSTASSGSSNPPIRHDALSIYSI